MDEDKVEVTDEQEYEAIEKLLKEKGVLVPGEDLVHYMVRNATYMKLIESQEFKDSGLNLDEILDEEFIREQFKIAGQTAGMMRFATLQIMGVEQTDEQVAEAVEAAKEIIK